MKFLFDKYKNSNGNFKFSLWLVLVTWLLVTFFLVLNDKEWHIPTNNEIQYIKGKIYVVPADYNQRIGGTNSAWHIELRTNDGGKMYFVCSYTAFYYTQYSDCGDGDGEGIKNSIDGRYGEVGWYKQKSLLGITNPYPQLASMIVVKGDDIVYERTTEQTIKRMYGYHKITIFFSLCTMLLLYYSILQPIYRVSYQKG